MALAARLPLALQARVTGQSRWELRYRDGRVVHEGQCEWFDAPRQGIVEARLLCPNGQVGVLGGLPDFEDRLFQLKVAVVGLGGPRTTQAQLLGVVTDPNGACVLYAWEYGPRRLVGPLQDNVTALRYAQLGALGPATCVGAAHA